MQIVYLFFILFLHCHYILINGRLGREQVVNKFGVVGLWGGGGFDPVLSQF